MIKGRLFWKILLVFWFILILTFELIWVVFALSDRPTSESFSAYHTALEKVARASIIIETEGVEAFYLRQQQWPPKERHNFRIIKSEQIPPHLDKHGIVSNKVTLLDGTSYIVSYNMHRSRDKFPTPEIFFNVPLPFVLIAIVGGLLFSFILANNLSRPMNQLKEAFSRLASGDLSIRLKNTMRLRHDEFHDLAIHFDAMVEQLNLLLKSREELLHDVSHELRTPLARLQLAIGLAQQNPNIVESSLERIELESLRLNKMIGEILAFSRSGFTKIPEEQYVDLITLTQVVVDDANYEAQQLDILVVLNVDEATIAGQVILNANAELIRRAIENITRNALRFSPKGGRIIVDLKSDGQQLILTVRDFGPGIEESKIKRIFEPFFRVQSSSSGKGYGLGLAIARKVIEHYEGTITAQNCLDGQGGLLITITFPNSCLAGITADYSGSEE